MAHPVPSTSKNEAYKTNQHNKNNCYKQGEKRVVFFFSIKKIEAQFAIKKIGD